MSLSNDFHILSPDEARSISIAIDAENQVAKERKAAREAERLSVRTILYVSKEIGQFAYDI